MSTYSEVLAELPSVVSIALTLATHAAARATADESIWTATLLLVGAALARLALEADVAVAPATATHAALRTAAHLAVERGALGVVALTEGAGEAWGCEGVVGEDEIALADSAVARALTLADVGARSSETPSNLINIAWL